jgi:polysaccharide export outer membrane protein
MRSSSFSLLILTAIFAASCASGADYSSNTANSGTSSAGSTSRGATAGTGAATPGAPVIMATDPGYRLSLGDEISIEIHGQPDMSAAQRIDKTGAVRMPYINEVNLANKTVREAESFIEQTLVAQKLLKKPLVNITVRDYAVHEVTISGTGLNPGIFPLPRETSSIEIVELVQRLGGFRPTAKSDSVKVIRTDDNGKETVQTVDVESMIYGKKNALKSFLIYPGDRIVVDERIF